MAGLLEPMSRERADESAVDDGRRRVSWSEVDSRVNRWVHLVRSRGIRRGDRVAVVAGNRVETVEIMLACLHAGLVLIPVNWHLTAPEIAYQLSDSDSVAVLADEDHAAVTAQAVRESGLSPLLAAVYGADDQHGFAAVEPLLAAMSDTEPADQVSGTVGLYTSGTTGKPKYVVSNLFGLGDGIESTRTRVDRICAHLGIRPTGANLLCGPWYHSGQLFFCLLPLLHGAPLITRARFDPAETLRLIDEHAVSQTHLVPTQFVRFLRLDDTVRTDFSGHTLRRVWHGGAPCPAELKRQMIDWWGPVLVEYYAATEGGIATVIDSVDWLRHPGSVGRAMAGTRLLIVDEDGNELPPGREGRVFLRRRTGFEYQNAPEKTRAAHLGDGTFTYGEIGRLDDEGYLYLTGRAGDMIVSGGVNVYPAEVQIVLLDHPAVLDAVVFGVPDEEFGQRVCAVVELDPEAGLADPDKELDRHCRTRLAGFKVPRSYQVVPSLPREASGKVRRLVLRERFGAD
ncbi:AMP-binding protein [Actinokineospora enzanensis]|uniref:AMP-binding protein n=1 Tax=Actinokineospora enzanensis TaxID=155975 RepID=UPI000381EE14|nr:AMP-binding protein [Actinokineospora enzanensis]